MLKQLQIIVCILLVGTCRADFTTGFFSPTVALQSNESPPVLNSLTTGLVAFWKLGESAGATRADSIGGNNLADVGTATQVAGIVGNAAGFNGSSQYLTTPSSKDLLMGGTDLTIAGWIYITTAGQTKCVFSKYGGTLNEYYMRTSAGVLTFGVVLSTAGGVTVTSSAGNLSATTWHFFTAWRDNTLKTVNLQVDGGTVDSVSWTQDINNSNGNFEVGRFSSNNQHWNGRIDALGVWKRVLTTQERANLYAAGVGAEWPFGATPDPAFEIFSPAPYQISQRTGSTGVVSVVACLRNASDSCEVQFNNGSWTNVATGVRGWFTNTIAGNQGQGTFNIRMVSRPAITASSAYVGIGDVFVIAGQSNASGRGTNKQTNSHPVLKGGLFGNDYLWHILADSTDDPTNQVDSVSNDGGLVTASPGSIWPIVGSMIATNLATIPVGFIPCAMGGTAISQWAAGTNHQDRATLYGSMVYRALQAGGCKSILWIQGEQDAVNGVSTATYQTALLTLATNIVADLGVKMIPAKIVHMTDPSATQSEQDAINLAIGNTWGTANILAGPDLSVITSDDTAHFKTDAKLLQAAGLFWAKIQAAFYP